MHPDVRGVKRFVVGTGLQMRKGGTSHKRPSCKFHDVSLVVQGDYIKTMNQVRYVLLYLYESHMYYIVNYTLSKSRVDPKIVILEKY